MLPGHASSDFGSKSTGMNVKSACALADSASTP